MDRAQVFAVSGPDCYSNFYICVALEAIMSNTDKGIHLCGSLSFYIKKKHTKSGGYFSKVSSSVDDVVSMQKCCNLKYFGDCGVDQNI